MTAWALEAVRPICPECGAELPAPARPADMPVALWLRLGLPTTCPCGWQGHARWATPQKGSA